MAAEVDSKQSGRSIVTQLQAKVRLLDATELLFYDSCELVAESPNSAEGWHMLNRK